MADLRVIDLRCEFAIDPLAIASRSPRLSWRVESDGRHWIQTAYQIQAATTIERLAAPDLWDSGVVASQESLDVRYHGQDVGAATDIFWRVQVQNAKGHRSEWSAPARWTRALRHQGDWRAHWICRPTTANWTEPQPVQLVRKTFELPNKPIKRARLYVSARGLIEPWLNGAPATDGRLLPGWKDYTKRMPYVAIDVTPIVRPGKNALGAYVGDGWYAGSVCWFGRNQYGAVPMGLLSLRVDYADQDPIVIGSDSSWKAAASGIQSADLLHGEFVDLDAEPMGWSQPEFDDAAWANAWSTPLGATPLEPKVGAVVKAVEALEPKEIVANGPKTWRIDFGQNHAGVVELDLPPGPVDVTLHHAEILNNGDLYLDNLRSAKATDRAKCSCSDQKSFPKFTFHGYRYAEVSGLEVAPEAHQVRSHALHTDMRRTAWFECSHPLLNRLVDNALWSMRGNFVDVPTDCPQRDERLGWTGDAQVFAPTALLLYDCYAEFENWLETLYDGVSAEGVFPNIAPQLPELNDGAPGWADAGVLVPMAVYQATGDVEGLKRWLPGMKRYVDHILELNPDRLWRHGRSHDFGDWLSLGAETDKTFIASAFLINNLRILSHELGQAYHDLWSESMAAFRKAFAPHGELTVQTQTAYALALAFRLHLPGEGPKLAQRLVDRIRADGSQIATGFLGVSHLLPTLAQYGRFDVAYELLLNEKYPSWLYPITQGATTIWERWDGWTERGGFQDKGMNSFNHYAYGSVVEWLFRHIGGIQTIEPGYREFRLAPTPGGGLSHAKSRYDCRYGTIRSDWSIDSGAIRWNVEIPANTTATLVFPPNFKSWTSPDGALKLGKESYAGAKRSSLRLGSGVYEFHGKT